MDERRGMSWSAALTDFLSHRSKGVNALLIVFGMIVLAGGILVIGTLPDYFTELHKTLFYIITLIVAGVFITVAFK